jgi:hypothetical protein
MILTQTVLAIALINQISAAWTIPLLALANFPDVVLERGATPEVA